MSSTWAEKQSAVKAAVAKCLRLDVAGTVLLGDGTMLNSEAVAWENQREASRAVNEYWCDLRLGSVVTLGRDEKRREYVAGVDVETSGLRTTYGGQRIFTVMCIVGSDNQDADKAAIGQLGSLIRTRIRREDVLEILHDADIGLNQIMTTLNVDYMDEGVMMSQSLTEIRFNTSEEDLPEDDEITSYVNEASGSGVTAEDLEDASFQAGPVE